jgi:hypothetical protein
MKFDREKVLNFIGVSLIFFAIVNLIIKFFYGVLIEFFWFCNNVPIFMGISILLRKRKLFVGSFLLLIIPSLVWNIDFFSYLFRGDVLLGDVSYFQNFGNIFLRISSGFVHFSTLLLSTWTLFLVKGDIKNSWIYGFIYGLLFFPFSFLLQGKLFNLNCVLESCIPFIPNFELFPFVFIFVYVLVVMIPLNYLISKFIINR